MLVYLQSERRRDEKSKFFGQKVRTPKNWKIMTNEEEVYRLLILQSTETFFFQKARIQTSTVILQPQYVKDEDRPLKQVENWVCTTAEVHIKELLTF